MTTMQQTQKRTATPNKYQLPVQGTSIAPPKHKQATSAMKAHKTATGGTQQRRPTQLLLTRGSTDVALRPPTRTGIDTATCDGALTLQARSQLACQQPAWDRLLSLETRLPNRPSAADLNCSKHSCEHRSSCCTFTHATALNTAALGARPGHQKTLLPEDEAPRAAAARTTATKNLLQRYCPDAATKTAARRTPAAGKPPHLPVDL